MIWDFNNGCVLSVELSWTPPPPVADPVAYHRLRPLALSRLFRSSPQLYDPLHASSINSISRSVLSSALLTRAEAHPNITVHFSRKIARIDWTKRKAFVEGPTGGWEEPQEGEGAEGWSLCVGADGCWSKVRTSMLSAQP